MIKFRSMVIGADRSGVDSTSSDDRRITPVGHFIRRYKLDEFPELVNVLLGQMSLVGPRPNVNRDVALYTEQERASWRSAPGSPIWPPSSLPMKGKYWRGDRIPI